MPSSFRNEETAYHLHVLTMGYWDRFRKYLQGGPAAIDGWPAAIPIAQFNGAVAASLGAALTRHGFEPIAPRRWVRSTHAPIRHLVELQALKGVAYGPVWGLSLDFVPHVTGTGEIKRHRTAKSARFDLMFVPIDLSRGDAASDDWTVSPVATHEELQEDLGRVTRLTVMEALPFLDSIRLVRDLPATFAEERRRRSRGLPFENYTQQLLASAFVLAQSGGGTAELTEYVATSGVGPDTAAALAALLSSP